jgi:uncharacterized protein (TIGR00251 family)
MRIYLKVIPKAAKNEIIQISEGEFKVKLNAVPEKNKANQKLVDVLAEHFGVPKSAIEIIAGKTARTKIVEIKM